MEKVIFNCEVITPMFCGGPIDKEAEIKGSSIKGLMRFWWRAANAYRFNSIAEMKNEEGKIFGSTDSGNERKSSFKIKVNSKTKSVTSNKRLMQKFLSFGTYNCKNQETNQIFDRNYILPGYKFNIEFIIFKDEFKEYIIKSFYLLSYFGGIGSKTHNGFGNFFIKNIDDKFSFNKIIEEIKSNEFPANNYYKVHSFNNETKIFKFGELNTDSNQILSQFEIFYKELREPFSEEEKQFIGAPIKGQDLLKRKSKSLYFIINKINNSFQGYVLYLHSDICGDNERLNIKYREINYKLIEKIAEILQEVK